MFYVFRFQVLVSKHKREPRVIRGRARRCNRGRNSITTTGELGRCELWMNRESEDLPE